MHRLSLKDIVLGGVFAAFGLVYGGIALAQLPIGTPLNMGPGFFPVLLAALLLGIGLTIGAKSLFTAMPPDEFGRFAWRGLIAILAATVVFALTIQGLGLPAAIVATVLVASLASRRSTLLRAGLTASILAIGCTAIFIYGLKVPVPLVGAWFG